MKERGGEEGKERGGEGGKEREGEGGGMAFEREKGRKR